MLSHANFCQLVTNGPKNENETRNCVIPYVRSCSQILSWLCSRLGKEIRQGNLEKFVPRVSLHRNMSMLLSYSNCNWRPYIRIVSTCTSQTIREYLTKQSGLFFSIFGHFHSLLVKYSLTSVFLSHRYNIFSYIVLVKDSRARLKKCVKSNYIAMHSSKLDAHAHCRFCHLEFLRTPWHVKHEENLQNEVP